LKCHLRRRSAVEPEFGHMNNDGLLGRNFLKGMVGNTMNASLCGAGHNLRKLLAWIRLCLYGWATPRVRESCVLCLLPLLRFQVRGTR